MGNKMQAAESIRRLAVMFQGMVEAADTLEAIGSLEQATGEAQAARAKAEAARDAVLGEVRNAEQSIKNARADAQTLAENARGLAAQIERDATEEGRRIIADARDQVSQERLAAKGQLDQQLAAVRREIEQAGKRLVDLQGETAKARADADAANELRDEAQAGLDKVQEQIGRLSKVSV